MTVADAIAVLLPYNGEFSQVSRLRTHEVVVRVCSVCVCVECRFVPVWVELGSLGLGVVVHISDCWSEAAFAPCRRACWPPQGTRTR